MIEKIRTICRVLFFIALGLLVLWFLYTQGGLDAVISVIVAAAGGLGLVLFLNFIFPPDDHWN